MKLRAGLLLLLAGCQGQADRPVADGGPTIVSLNPCSDAILAEVSGPDQLLAISHFSHSARATSMPLDKAAQYRATGGTVEEVLALDPDVVVADIFLAPATRAALEHTGVQVESVGIAATVEESIAQIRQLAALSGNADAGEALVGRIEAAWASAAYDGPRRTVLLWQQGGIVPGESSLIAQLLEHSGFALHSAARGLGQGAYLPLEQVLADPPELVLAAGGERMLSHPVLQHLPGTRYASFDPALLYCGGPSIIRTLDRLTQIRNSLQ